MTSHEINRTEVFSDNWKGIDVPRGEKSTAAQMGYQEYELLDASSGNATATAILNGRGIKVDTAGIVKVVSKKQDGSDETEVLFLNAGQVHPKRRVYQLYRYYTGATAGTAKCYDSDGSQITNAIKIVR